MICPNCGKEYNEKMTCCISCGVTLVPFEKDTEQTVTAGLPQNNEADTIIPMEEAVSVCLPEDTGSVRHFERRDELVIPVKLKSKGKVLSGAVKFTGSFITALLMLALIIACVAAVVFRLVTDEKRISEFADTLDIMALPVSQAASGNQAETIQDTIYIMAQGTGLSRDDIRKIYEESTMKKFLAAQLTGYAEYIRNGTVPEKLTPEKLKKVFEENVLLIDNTIGHSLSSSDIQLACAEIERAEPLLEIISHENVENSLGKGSLMAIRLLGSLPAIVVTAALSASMLIVLHAINKKSTSVLGWGGGTILAGGAAVLAVTFLFSLQLPYTDSERFVRTIIKCTCDVISPDLYRIGAALAVLGTVMLIWAESLRRTESDRMQKKQ